MYPEIILGPPGTGKTTTLLSIVEEELEKGVPPDRIGYLSFTRRAAEEAIDRAQIKFGLSRNQFPYFRTIHSLCFKELGLRSSEILEGSKLQEFASWIGIKITGRWSEDGTFIGLENGDRILFLDNLSRIKEIPLRQLYNDSDETISWSEIDRVIRGLRVFKQENGLIDFTDILEEYIRRGNRPKLEVLLCDETQDQSHLQWRVVEKLAEGARRVCLSGDDDQSIFEWSGADVQRIITQEGDVKVLDRSYRVPRNIQDLSFSIINRVKFRRPKVWYPREGEGIIERIPNFSQIDMSGDDILILARNLFILNDLVEPELRRNGVIYSKNGHTSVKQGVLKAIVDWENLRSGGEIPVSQAINVYEHMSSGTMVKRGFKKLPGFLEEDFVTLSTLKESGGLLVDSMWNDALDRIPEQDRSYIIAARKRGEKVLKKPRVRISSIHNSKGAEAEHVILLKDVARKTHKEMENNPDAENRVWFVACTRAKTKLTLVNPSSNRFYPFI